MGVFDSERRETLVGAVFIISAFVAVTCVLAGDLMVPALAASMIAGIVLLFVRQKLVVIVAALAFVTIRLWFALIATMEWSWLPLCAIATAALYALFRYASSRQKNDV
jgi:hypothetical protein